MADNSADNSAAKRFKSDYNNEIVHGVLQKRYYTNVYLHVDNNKTREEAKMWFNTIGNARVMSRKFDFACGGLDAVAYQFEEEFGDNAFHPDALACVLELYEEHLCSSENIYAYSLDPSEIHVVVFICTK